MRRRLFLILCIIVLFVSTSFIGCNDKKEQLKTSGGLKIYSWSSALGGDLDKTKFTYFINLTNENQEDIFVTFIQPLVNESIKDRILSIELAVEINKNIKPSETIEIQGEIIVDTKGMGKSGISALLPFITDVKVSTEEILKLKWHE